MANKGIFIVGAAAAALFAMTRKKKGDAKKYNGKNDVGPNLTKQQEECFEDGADHVRIMPTGDEFCWWGDGRQTPAESYAKGVTVPTYKSAASAVEALESPEPTPGAFYQIRYGDNPIEVARSALFGSRTPDSQIGEAKRRAIYEYVLRIDCSPWNQTFYGKPIENLRDDHRNLIQEYANLGVSYNPFYSNNRARLISGLRPTSESGRSFAFIWLPEIDRAAFERDMTVTVEGQNWPDTEAGIGHSKLDPPAVVLDMGDANENRVGQEIEVGCPLPEGDFRKKLIKEE
jgi:hypothetical protein